MAVMLMSGAGLLIKSLWQLQRVDPGFNASGVLKAEFQLPASRYPQDRETFPNWPAQQRFYAELQARAAALPGVQSVAIAAANPLDAGFTSSIRVVGRESEGADWPEPSIRTVSSSYFATMNVPLADGRVFGAGDDAGAPPAPPPVAMINASARERYFGDRNPMGQRISLWGQQRTVIGVVGNEHVKGIDEAAPPAVYMPLAQTPIGNAVLLRVVGDPSSFAPAIRRIVAELDPAPTRSRSAASRWCRWGHSRPSRCCSRPSACTACWATPSRSAPGRSGSAWPWAPTRAVCGRSSCPKARCSPASAWPSVSPARSR
jgi:putative ABC transport system permease protein